MCVGICWQEWLLIADGLEFADDLEQSRSQLKIFNVEVVF